MATINDPANCTGSVKFFITRVKPDGTTEKRYLDGQSGGDVPSSYTSSFSGTYTHYTAPDPVGLGGVHANFRVSAGTLAPYTFPMMCEADPVSGKRPYNSVWTRPSDVHGTDANGAPGYFTMVGAYRNAGGSLEFPYDSGPDAPFGDHEMDISPYVQAMVCVQNGGSGAPYLDVPGVKIKILIGTDVGVYYTLMDPALAVTRSGPALWPYSPPFINEAYIRYQHSSTPAFKHDPFFGRDPSLPKNPGTIFFELTFPNGRVWQGNCLTDNGPGEISGIDFCTPVIATNEADAIVIQWVHRSQGWTRYFEGDPNYDPSARSPITGVPDIQTFGDADSWHVAFDIIPGDFGVVMSTASFEAVDPADIASGSGGDQQGADIARGWGHGYTIPGHTWAFILPAGFNWNNPYVPPPGHGNGPSNTHQGTGPFHRVAVGSGAAVSHWSSVGAIPASGLSGPHVIAAPPSGQADGEPRLGINALLMQTAVWSRVHTDASGQNVMSAHSWDDGLTWSIPTVAIPNGTHPDIAEGITGTRIVAAVVNTAASGDPPVLHIQATVQHPGDPSPSSVFTFVDSAGAPLSVADDTFGITQGHDGMSPWLLSVVISGASSTSEWASFDSCQSWVQVS